MEEARINLKKLREGAFTSDEIEDEFESRATSTNDNM